MHFDTTSNRKTQMVAMLMTVCVVGGAILYAMTAA